RDRGEAPQLGRGTVKPRMFTALARTLCLWVIIEPLPALAQVDRCAGEGAQLAREQAELPARDLTPPRQRQVVCLSLEPVCAGTCRLARPTPTRRSRDMACGPADG